MHHRSRCSLRLTSISLSISLILSTVSGSFAITTTNAQANVDSLHLAGISVQDFSLQTAELGMADLKLAPAGELAAEAALTKASVLKDLDANGVDLTNVSLPEAGVGAAAMQSLTGLVKTFQPKADNGAALERTFDAQAARGDESSEVSSGGDNDEDEANAAGLTKEQKKLHDDYAEKAKQRVEALNEKLKQFQSGPFRLALIQAASNQGLVLMVLPVIKGKPYRAREVEQLFAGGQLSPADRTHWAKTRQAAQEYGQALEEILAENQNEHEAVHKKIEEERRAVLKARVKERLRVAEDLQEWGIPNTISIDGAEPSGLRYVELYHMSGAPTDVGMGLHQVLKSLLTKDPAMLSRITSYQLHNAVKLVSDGQLYVADPTGDQFLRAQRFGAMMEDYSYPEWRDAFYKKAQEALTSKPQPGDKPYGLGHRAENQRPAKVVQKVLEDVLSDYQEKIHNGASEKDIQDAEALMIAFATTAGLPLQTNVGAVPLKIQHKQLLPVLAELQKRNAHEQVIKAVIRSFPLGESIYRLGIHKLWAKGLSGEGIKIAVLDNGADFGHPDYEGAKTRSENFTRDRGWFTKGNHGTPMADIYRAFLPNAEIQSYQVLPNTPFQGVRLSGEEMNEALLKALDRARANGANVINMSLGTPGGIANDAVTEKISQLAKEGILTVVSAGNSHLSIPGHSQLGSPATGDDAIAVGAVDYHGNRALFSSGGLAFNTETHALNERPDIYVFGVNNKAAMRLPRRAYEIETSPYGEISGTSPASPHVGSVVAFMLEAAMKANLNIKNYQSLTAAKEALVSASEFISRLPVLQSAEKAAEKFVELLGGKDNVVASAAPARDRAARAGKA